MNWIPEPQAAEKVRKKPRTLRKLVKAKLLPISYTTVNGRGYQYSEKDIIRLLNNNSVNN